MFTVCGLRFLGLLLALVALSARGEEFTLQNGQKIVGTIVGFENDMFRVETDFGFALIRKDRVRSVSFGKGGVKDASPKRSEREPAAAGLKGAASTPEKAPAPDSTQASPSGGDSRPLDKPLPAQIQEHLEGTNYINDTFQFSMYKPPGWKVHEGVPRETGRAIVAIGTEDEQTLLFVDRQEWSGVPDLRSDLTEANLRHTYQDYQALSESSLQLDGHPAVRHDFRGLMDGVEWHGISVRVSQGNTVFGIVGLTSAETYQFQQALLNKIINSFRFRAAKSDVSASR